MGQPAAKANDSITATDTHVVMIPVGTGTVPTPLPHPFLGTINGGLSRDVFIDGQPAAPRGATADNTPPHIPQGGPFQSPPANRGEILTGSATVHVNGVPLARHGDTALTCNDPTDLPVGSVIAVGTVFAG
ncbi:PAAR domain-containing protein [Rhodobaculum claviforme]|uniref:PAAR motif protein n=1 Tax=Rhodobaculum claviforme TaxID=1549854 RepID=A0A934TJ62_9RHOB|nr:PAAR domain-containing protein [Rhodobaculum claviforme]MBK5926172.1 hypothetical protein [Rhodobaculum claviforme]